jgi:Alpha/beta hydrolase family
VTRADIVTFALDDAPKWLAKTINTTGNRGGQVLVGVVDGRVDTGGMTFVVALGYRAHVEAFEMQRFQLIAAILRSRLLVVETPGFGGATSRILPRERRALLRGDFTPLARRLLSAAVDAIDGDTTVSTIGLIGYSLGASTSAALARVANSTDFGPHVDTVVLVEPVALRPWGVRELLSASRQEDLSVQRYLNETSMIENAVQPWDRRREGLVGMRSRADMAVLANALRTPRMAGDLLGAAASAKRPLQRVFLIQGVRSALSDHRKAAELAKVLTDRGVQVRTLRTSGGHAFWHSLPRVLDVVGRLRDLIAADAR